MGKIFISHSSANNAEALAIHDWLAEQGWGDVFLDLDPKRGLVAGDRWQAALKAAAEQCELILIMISPEWAASRWCLAEFLLAKQMNKQILGVVVKPTPLADLPVELTAEWQLVDLSAPDVGWSATISPPRYEPETTVNFSSTGLARLRSGLEKAGIDATTFNWPPPHDLGRAPYRGLLPLDHDDAGIFFGRDGAIVLTLDALRGMRAEAAPRFATILGASGAGKSSFLRAGILPRLGRDSSHFYVLPVIRPERAALTGEHGLAQTLEKALKRRGISRNKADIRDAMAAGAEGVAPILRQLAIPADAGDAAGGDPPTLVLAVDQAEELLSADNAEASAFLTLLADLGRCDDPAMIILFAVRSDSFDQLQSRPELAITQPHRLIDLPPVPAGAFGDIIRGPARRLTAAGRKLNVDETLVDALLGDIEAGGTKDALPLLAFTLERLYTDYGADGDLQLAEYEKLGRIRGAIEAAVDGALQRADGNGAIPRDRAARLALLRRGLIPWLAGIDPATGSPRRRVARLAEVPVEARPLIELLVEQRLLATDVDTDTKEVTIEPAHEALLRQWGALDGWLTEDSADLATIEALRRAASEWDANARGTEFVIHKGARLSAVEQLAGEERFATYLTSIDRAYLSTARNVENAAIKKARAARTRLTIAASVAGVVLLGGATAGYFVWSAGEAAKREAEVSFLTAQAEAALREGRPEDGAAAALAAYELAPSAATRTRALEAAMSISPNALGRIEVDARVVDALWLDERRAAALTADGKVTIFDAGTGARTVTQFPAGLDLAGLVPDGAGGVNILTGDVSLVKSDGSVVAAPTSEMFFQLAGAHSTSADGKKLLLIGLTGEALLRDCSVLPCIDTLVPTGGLSISGAMRGDGAAFALATESGTVEVYRDVTQAPVSARLPADAALGALAWGNDRLLVEVRGRGVWSIDPTSGIAVAVNDELSLTALAVAASGEIALGCDGGMLCFLGDDGTRRGAISGHNGPVASVRWSPDGTALLSLAPGEPVRLWSREENRQIAFGLPGMEWTPLTALTIDPARDMVVAGDERGQLHVWTAEGGTVSTAPALPGRVTSLDFLTDGRTAAVVENKGVTFYNAGGDVAESSFSIDNASFSRLAALSGDVRAAVPLTDGRIMAFSGEGLRATELARDGGTLTPWGLVAATEPNTAYLSYSDGSIGKRDLGAGTDGLVVYDASQPLCGTGATTDNNGAKSLDLSADGKWLVATRSDAMIIVHNLADPTKPVCLTLPSRDSKTVAFSPDSTRLAVLSATDRLYVFNLAQPDAPIIYGAAAVPENSPLTVGAGAARTTSWLAWRDDTTIALSTTGGVVENIVLDPAAWRARVDTLTPSP